MSTPDHEGSAQYRTTKIRTYGFTAFYPSRPFWAVDKIDFSDPKSEDHFQELMSEEVYEEADEMFSVKICRDGRIMVRVEALEKEDANSNAPVSADAMVGKWGEYLDYLNSFYLLLDSSTIRSMNLAYFSLHEITIRDAFRVHYQNGKISGENIAAESVASLFQLGRFKSTYGLPIPNDPKILMRRVISWDAIANAVKQFGIVVKSPGLEKVLGSFTKSIAEYKVGNYETSIILAWFISERVIDKIWIRHIASLNKDIGEGRQRMNRERKDYLTGRDFPISLVANVLELFDVLPFSLFKDVDAVRGFRNKIVHGGSGYSPNATDAQLAIKTALELSRASYGIDFTPNFAYWVTGF